MKTGIAESERTSASSCSALSPVIAPVSHLLFSCSSLVIFARIAPRMVNSFTPRGPRRMPLLINGLEKNAKNDQTDY